MFPGDLLSVWYHLTAYWALREVAEPGTIFNRGGEDCGQKVEEEEKVQGLEVLLGLRVCVQWDPKGPQGTGGRQTVSTCHVRIWSGKEGRKRWETNTSEHLS